MEEGRVGRILIIDDTQQNIALLRAQLERAGHTVIAATNGPDGLALARSEAPDLILLDLMMPGMDGFEVCRRLKAADATRAIPVIVLTSLREREDKLRALEAGAEDFLSRPVDRAELLARVRSLVRLKHLHDTLAERAEQLALERNRAEAILHSMSDGVLTTNVRAEITLLNAAAERMTGQRVREVLGRPWLDALRVHDPAGHPLTAEACPIREALRTGTAVVDREVTIVRPDGRKVAVRLAAAPVRRLRGVAAGAVVVLHDVTRQREMERMKQELTALVSHELRTPLAAIYGYAELLVHREVLSDQGRQCAETIHREAQRMTNLINDFLEMRHLESSRFSYHMRPVALHELLGAVQYRFAPRLTRHRLVLDAPAEPITLHTDDERLGQVLANLVSNAIKYSPAGGEIRLMARVEGSDLKIAMRDEGLGLPPEALPRLFQKFYRVEHHRQQGIEGTGLGLAICHQIVTELGGRIWAESAGLGHGSTFTFTVPLDSRTVAS